MKLDVEIHSSRNAHYPLDLVYKCLSHIYPQLLYHFTAVIGKLGVLLDLDKSMLKGQPKLLLPIKLS